MPVLDVVFEPALLSPPVRFPRGTAELDSTSSDEAESSVLTVGDIDRASDWCCFGGFLIPQNIVVPSIRRRANPMLEPMAICLFMLASIPVTPGIKKSPVVT